MTRIVSSAGERLLHGGDEVGVGLAGAPGRPAGHGGTFGVEPGEDQGDVLGHLHVAAEDVLLERAHIEDVHPSGSAFHIS